MSITHIEQSPDHGFSTNTGLLSLDAGESLQECETPLEPVEFLRPADKRFARALDERGIEWQYKPRTFAVEWDDDGNFLDCFSPDFYLPACDLFIQLAAKDRSGADARKVRLLHWTYPSIRIELIELGSQDSYGRSNGEFRQLIDAADTAPGD
jgi:hypothetical protein